MDASEPGPVLAVGGLVGRTAELATIQRIMARGRLTTITGLPGVGKTAVAFAAAAAVSAGFADGVWLVALDLLRDEDSLPHAIANALKLPDLPDGRQWEALVDELWGRRLLLVLDTCEHLAAACARLAMRLLPCAGVRIMATSREPLRVPGGLTVTIRPLPLGLAEQMFGVRAGEASPGFEITAENRDAVTAICRRLDRLPLGIELAARQLPACTVRQLESRLQGDYWFLQNTAAATARHESLKAAIGWSYELCTPAEQLAWARLSVFPGSFQLPDAEQVCADHQLPREAVATAVSALAARSVLAMDLRAGRQARFRLPATLRAYGADMLGQLGDERWQRRYRAWRGVQIRDQTGGGAE